MFPLVAIGGVIGAVMSVAKGASWLSDQITGSKTAGSAGAKSGPTPVTEAQTSAFAATLAAQTAGQSVPTNAPAAPVSTGSATASVSLVSQQHGTDYAMLARMKAGVVAYSHIGEHRGSHAASHPAAGDDTLGAAA